MISFNDLRAQYAAIEPELRAAIDQVIAKAAFINGSAVGAFERAFAQYCEADHCVGVSSGTSALHLAMKAAGIGPGDEVITTPFTFIATAEAIGHCGATVEFADIDSETLNLDPAIVEAAITPRTRAILFVHLHGNPTGAAECAQVARRHGLLFFEDCAQAHGALYQDSAHVGSLAVASTYSFFPAKNLGAFGDAGAITTNDADLAENARRLANHGRTEKYVHREEGYNHRMDTIQAAVLKTRLAGLEESVVMRGGLAEQYQMLLASLPLKFQRVDPSCRCAWHLFSVRTPMRNKLAEHFHQNQIQTGIHYPVPLHLQPAYEYRGWKTGEFPQAECAANETLSLPFYPGMPTGHIAQVAESMENYFASAIKQP